MISLQKYKEQRHSRMTKVIRMIRNGKYVYQTKDGKIETSEPMSDIEAEQAINHFANYESWSS